jgi:SNF2 family DNA or RNA helicase
VLQLRFSARAGRVEVRSDLSNVAALYALRSRFVSAISTAQEAFEVEVDDLLVNLYEMASWPATAGNVTWQPELLALVESNAADATTVETRLTAPGAASLSQAPSSLGGGWDAPLTDFQRRDLGKLLELAHGANFSVPGAGKTRVSLAGFQARRDAGEIAQALVVSPKSAFESWLSEVQTCYPVRPPAVAIFDGVEPPVCDILLVNYERLDARAMLLRWMARAPTLLVLDEAHRMKLGPSGAWGAACLALGPYATRRLILTGTPAPNGARDLENLFSFVWPGRGRVSVRAAIGDGNDMAMASARLKPLFTRTTKLELGLPRVDTVIRRIPLPPLHRELYDALLGQFSGRWRGGEQDALALGRVLLYLLMAATTPALLATGTTKHEPLPYRVPPLEPPPGSSLASLLRDLPHYELSPKYAEALSIVTANAEAGRKTLIWSTFVRNLTSLEHLLAEFQPAIVHGGSEDRAEQLRRFREDPECMVLLSNPATLGEGVSLHQVCNDAIYIDRDFAAGRYLQSRDRIHRLGLRRDQVTRITVLAAAETVDDLVEERLRAKLAFMAGVLDDPAVMALSDLDEEPTQAVGMDASDLGLLGRYLSGGSPS